jgi:hypothetical protein
VTSINFEPWGKLYPSTSYPGSFSLLSIFRPRRSPLSVTLSAIWFAVDNTNDAQLYTAGKMSTFFFLNIQKEKEEGRKRKKKKMWTFSSGKQRREKWQDFLWWSWRPTRTSQTTAGPIYTLRRMVTHAERNQKSHGFSAARHTAIWLKRVNNICRKH